MHHKNYKTWLAISLLGITQYTLFIVGNHIDLSSIGLMDENGQYKPRILIPLWLCVICIDLFYANISLFPKQTVDIDYAIISDRRTKSDNVR